MKHSGALLVILGSLFLVANLLRADPPTASYIFPAGGQRGKTIAVRVGGLNLYQSCGFEMLGAGVEVPKTLRRTKTLWFEGPILPLPESQQQEDYPQDMAGKVVIAGDAPLGVRHWRLWTSQGATPAQTFVVGDLPEIVEEEIDGDPVPVEVRPPVTINGRIFPREDVDVWSFAAQKGQTFTCEVNASRLGSPLDARLEIRDPRGVRIAEKVAERGDPVLRFTATAAGNYQVRIHDTSFRGGQAYVYRLTITSDPYVDRVYPLGGRRGSSTKFEFSGQGLPAEPIAVTLPADGASDYTHRLTTGGETTNAILLDLDDLPEYRHEDHADPVSLPAILNGRIVAPREVHTWSVVLKKSETVELDLRAARLGSPLSGVLTVHEENGKELARADATAAGQLDPSLRFTVPADGKFLIRVAEHFPARGGAAFAYRLRVAPPSTVRDFRLRLGSDVVSINRGTSAKLKISAERFGGVNDPITLTIEGLPAGVTATGTTIAQGQNATEITLTAGASATIDATRLSIRGSVKVGEQTLTRTATLARERGVPDIESVLLAVTLPTPFKVVGEYDMGWAARGTVHHRKYHIERNGFDGPLEVMLADHQARHLQGVTGPTITVPAGVNEFDYPVTLPPWMETGRTSRTCVMAVGIIKDAGREHTVSFTSINQNEQVVAVIQPGKLGIELERTSLAAEPGKTINVVVTVSRGRGLDGPVKVELVIPAHVRSLSGSAVEIPTDQTKGTLSLRFAAGPCGPYNMPLTVRATLLHKGEPITAETKLEILASR
jgi:hypothetical protein